MPRVASNHQKLGERHETCSPLESQGGTSHANNLILDLDLQDCGRMNFCSYKPPSLLWWLQRANPDFCCKSIQILYLSGRGRIQASIVLERAERVCLSKKHSCDLHPNRLVHAKDTNAVNTLHQSNNRCIWVFSANPYTHTSLKTNFRTSELWQPYL